MGYIISTTELKQLPTEKSSSN